MSYPKLIANMDVVTHSGKRGDWAARMMEISPNLYAVGTVFKEEKANAVRTCDYAAGVKILLKCWIFLHSVYNYIHIMQGDHHLLANMPKILEIGEA